MENPCCSCRLTRVRHLGVVVHPDRERLQRVRRGGRHRRSSLPPQEPSNPVSSEVQLHALGRRPAGVLRVMWARRAAPDGDGSRATDESRAAGKQRQCFVLVMAMKDSACFPCDGDERQCPVLVAAPVAGRARTGDSRRRRPQPPQAWRPFGEVKAVIGQVNRGSTTDGAPSSLQLCVYCGSSSITSGEVPAQH